MLTELSPRHQTHYLRTPSSHENHRNFSSIALDDPATEAMCCR